MISIELNTGVTWKWKGTELLLEGHIVSFEILVIFYFLSRLEGTYVFVLFFLNIQMCVYMYDIHI